jgi:hypothetical protein
MTRISYMVSIKRYQSSRSGDAWKEWKASRRDGYGRVEDGSTYEQFMED